MSIQEQDAEIAAPRRTRSGGRDARQKSRGGQAASFSARTSLMSRRLMVRSRALASVRFNTVMLMLAVLSLKTCLIASSGMHVGHDYAGRRTAEATRGSFRQPRLLARMAQDSDLNMTEASPDAGRDLHVPDTHPILAMQCPDAPVSTGHPPALTDIVIQD